MNAARQTWIERARAVPIETIAPQGLKRQGKELVGACPACGGHDRFSVKPNEGLWSCRGCPRKANGKTAGGDVISLAMLLWRCDFAAAVERLTGEPAPSGGEWRTEGEWTYQDADGKPFLKVVRCRKPNGKKVYLQHRFEGGRWVKGKPAGAKIPYRLPELLDSDRTERAYICEGEKCADAVAGLGLTATSASEGAGKWTPDLSEWFHDRIVYILPDNDQPGAKHAEQVAENLAAVARDVRIIPLPDIGDGGDIYDWIARGGTRERLQALGAAVPKWSPKAAENEQLARSTSARTRGKTLWHEKLVDARSLYDKHFEPVRYAVPNLFPEGVVLLVSRPKVGKSWLILQILTSVANGTGTLMSGDDNQPPPHGDGLYLALEDGERRLNRRLMKYFGSRECCPQRLNFATTWHRLDQGGLDDLHAWCKSVPKPTLIAIDTLKRVRAPKRRTQTDYEADYEACEGLLALTHEFPSLTIIVSHHDRKMDAEDVFDTVSGTLGLTAGIDTIAIIKRSRLGTTLHVQGRDLVDTIEKAVSFDRETCRWTILGEAAAVQLREQRTRVLAALKTEPDGLSVTEIIGRARLLNRNAADLLLGRMVADGEIERIKRGVYGMPGTRSKLSAEKMRQKDRKKGKSLNSQDDSHLSVDLSHHSTTTDKAPAHHVGTVPPPAPSASRRGRI